MTFSLCIFYAKGKMNYDFEDKENEVVEIFIKIYQNTLGCFAMICFGTDDSGSGTCPLA